MESTINVLIYRTSFNSTFYFCLLVKTACNLLVNFFFKREIIIIIYLDEFKILFYGWHLNYFFIRRIQIKNHSCTEAIAKVKQARMI